jgi:hypothetical protein
MQTPDLQERERRRDQHEMIVFLNLGVQIAEQRSTPYPAPL